MHIVRALAASSVAAAGIAGAIGATTTASPAAAATTAYSLVSLGATVSGGNVTTSTVVKTTDGTSVAATYYGVCARDASGANRDFWKRAATILPTGTSYISDVKSFAAGTYTYFACLYANGSWYNVGAAKTFTVGTTGTASPSPTPTATPKPTTSPTATATPKPTATATPTPTATPTVTATPTASATPTLTATASGPLGPAGSWNEVFADEFNSTSLDTTKWTKGWFGSGITSPVQSQEQECYDPAQVSVSGGVLNLSLIAKQETCGGVTRPFASGLVGSSGKFEFTYGYAEARVYLPPAADGSVANWPAFWTDGHTWPSTCENDVMEGLGGGAAYHYMNSAGTWWGGYAPNPNSYTGWHTFASDWEPGSVTYYYDGVKLGTLSQSCSAPHYLILNNATEKNRNTVADMKVDWVRVWKRAV